MRRLFLSLWSCLVCGCGVDEVVGLTLGASPSAPALGRDDGSVPTYSSDAGTRGADRDALLDASSPAPDGGRRTRAFDAGRSTSALDASRRTPALDAGRSTASEAGTLAVADAASSAHDAASDAGGVFGHPDPASFRQGRIDLADRASTPYQRVSGPTGEQGRLGVPVASGFDLDGDGLDDFVRASFLASGSAGYASGVVYLLMGDGASLPQDIDLGSNPSNVIKIYGAAGGEATGSEVWLDDVTGDGIGDLLICRQNYSASDPDRPGAGAVSVLAGGPELRALLNEARAQGGQAAIDLANPDPRIRLFTIVGRQTTGRFGMWVRSGDVTGDSVADMVVGADQESGEEGTRHGAVYLFRGGRHLAQPAAVDLSASEGSPLDGHVARITPGLGSSDFHLGATVQLGDLDRNGRAEVIASAALVRSGASLSPPGAPGSAVSRGGAPGGRVFIAWDDNFPDTLWPDDFSFAMTEPPGTVTTIVAGAKHGIINHQLGEELIAGEDYDGNGRPDLFLGDMTADVVGTKDGRFKASAGAGFLLFNADALRAESLVSLSTPPADVRVTSVIGAVSSSILGDTAQGGDFNGDAISDLAIAAPADTPEGRAQAGVTYLLWGNTRGFPELIDASDLPSPTEVPLTRILGAAGGFGNDSGDMLAYSAAATDADGDGKTDLVLNEMGGNGIGPNARDTGNYVLLSGAVLAAVSPDCSGRLGGTATYDACGVCGGSDVPGQASEHCVSFAYDVQPILFGHCTQCHGASGGLNAFSYAQLMLGQSDHGPVVRAGRGPESELVKKMRGVAGFGELMPPGAPIDSSKIDLISQWISEGARNN